MVPLGEIGSDIHRVTHEDNRRVNRIPWATVVPPYVIYLSVGVAGCATTTIGRGNRSSRSTTVAPMSNGLAGMMILASVRERER